MTTPGPPPEGHRDASVQLEKALSLVGAGAAARAVTSVAFAASALATTIILVRSLEPSIYGALAFGLSAVYLLAAFTGMAVGPASARTLAAQISDGDVDGARDLVRGLRTWILGGGLLGLALVVGIMLVSQPELDANQRLALGLGLGTFLVGRNAAVAAGAQAQGMGRVVSMELPTLFAILSQLALVVWVAISPAPSLTLIGIGFGVVGLLTVAVSLGVMHRLSAGADRPFRLSPESSVRLVRMVAPYAVLGIALVVITNFDVFVLGLARSSDVVATYEPVVRTVSWSLALVAGLLTATYVPAATSLHTRGHVDGFGSMYRSVSTINYVLTFPVVVLWAIDPTGVLRLVYGPGFPASTAVVWILLAGGIIHLVFGMNASALVASGERAGVAWAATWPLVAMVLMAVLLIPLFGSLGAAIATSGALMVFNLSMSWHLHRATGVHPFTRDLVMVMATSPVALGVAAAIRAAVGDNLAVAVAATIAGWLVWLGVMRLLSAFRPSDILQFLPRRSDRGVSSSS